MHSFLHAGDIRSSRGKAKAGFLVLIFAGCYPQLFHDLLVGYSIFNWWLELLIRQVVLNSRSSFLLTSAPKIRVRACASDVCACLRRELVFFFKLPCRATFTPLRPSSRQPMME